MTASAFGIEIDAADFVAGYLAHDARTGIVSAPAAADDRRKDEEIAGLHEAIRMAARSLTETVETEKHLIDRLAELEAADEQLRRRVKTLQVENERLQARCLELEDRNATLETIRENVPAFAEIERRRRDDRLTELFAIGLDRVFVNSDGVTVPLAHLVDAAPAVVLEAVAKFAEVLDAESLEPFTWRRA